jgi:hypothetical protein
MARIGADGASLPTLLHFYAAFCRADSCLPIGQKTTERWV